jgi:hypothetical protein
MFAARSGFSRFQMILRAIRSLRGARYNQMKKSFYKKIVTSLCKILKPELAIGSHNRFVPKDKPLQHPILNNCKLAIAALG